METIDGNRTECSRRDAVAPLADAGTPERQHGRYLEKPLCEERLGIVGAPRGSEVERDGAYLGR